MPNEAACQAGSARRLPIVTLHQEPPRTAGVRRVPFERTSDEFRKGGELEIGANPLYSSLSGVAFALQPPVQEEGGHRPSITCPAPRRVARSFSSSMTSPWLPESSRTP